MPSAMRTFPNASQSSLAPLWSGRVELLPASADCVGALVKPHVAESGKLSVCFWSVIVFWMNAWEWHLDKLEWNHAAGTGKNCYSVKPLVSTCIARRAFGPHAAGAAEILIGPRGYSIQSLAIRSVHWEKGGRMKRPSGHGTSWRQERSTIALKSGRERRTAVCEPCTIAYHLSTTRARVVVMRKGSMAASSSSLAPRGAAHCTPRHTTFGGCISRRVIRKYFYRPR
nr:hypothetical protein CFP56_00400 [Quercus suber]